MDKIKNRRLFSECNASSSKVYRIEIQFITQIYKLSSILTWVLLTDQKKSLFYDHILASHVALTIAGVVWDPHHYLSE